MLGRGDDGRGLDPDRAGPDQADPLAAEIDAFVRPRAGVVPVGREAIEARDFRDVRGRQAADGADEELRRDALSAIGPEVPAVRGLVEDR